MVGGVGYAIAVLFILRGAPDLALTQILVETVTLIAALLVLTRLPDDALYATHKGNGFRAVIAVAAGALMTGAGADHPGHPDGRPRSRPTWPGRPSSSAAATTSSTSSWSTSGPGTPTARSPC